MQHVLLLTYTPPDKKSSYTVNHYWTVLIPAAWLYFSSKRAMLAWFAELNRHLNGLAHDLNSLLATLYQEYRYYYFHLNDEERKLIDQELQQINRQFMRLVNPILNSRSNLIAYQHLSNILQGMNQILSTLERNDMNKLATVQRHRLNSLRQLLQYNEARYSEFPQNGPAKIELREN
jgi:hypothetical protein